MQDIFEGPSPESLSRLTMSGVGWSAGTKLTTQIVRFASSIVLARLIEPSAFGLVAMLALLMVLASTLTDIGLGSALVQSKSLTTAELNTAFWTSAISRCLFDHSHRLDGKSRRSFL